MKSSTANKIAVPQIYGQQGMVFDGGPLRSLLNSAPKAWLWGFLITGTAVLQAEVRIGIEGCQTWPCTEGDRPLVLWNARLGSLSSGLLAVTKDAILVGTNNARGI